MNDARFVAGKFNKRGAISKSLACPAIQVHIESASENEIHPSFPLGTE